jgi:hypothetical protein
LLSVEGKRRPTGNRQVGKGGPKRKLERARIARAKTVRKERRSR